MKKNVKILLWGILLWLVLFIVGFIIYPLHDTNFLLFKTIMVVSSCLVGMIMLALYFKKVENNFVSEGIAIGIIWLAVNLLLDLIVLVGLFKTPVGEYFIGIGLRYLNIPIISIGIGKILSYRK